MTKDEAPTYFTDKHAQSMTLRDHFAGLAMQGMFASDTAKWNEEGDWPSRADAAYAMAFRAPLD